MYTKLLHKICFLIAFVGRPIYSEVFSATAHLDSLLQTQETVIENIENYIYDETQRIDKVKTLLEPYKIEHKKATKDVNYVNNPINAFTLIKRLTDDLQAIEEIVLEVLRYRRASNVTYPTQDDLNGAIDSLTRLQDLYQIDTAKLANGTLQGTFRTPMSVSDCCEIGGKLLQANEYERAIEWLKEALYKYNPGSYYPPSVSVKNIMISISYAYKALGNTINQMKWIKKLYAMYPRSDGDIMQHYEKHLQQKELYKEQNAEAESLKDSLDIGYEMQCRDELDIPVIIKSRLKCWYHAEYPPFLKLAPVKVEQLYLDPEVLLFYGAISDQEIDKIKNISKPKLMRSMVSCEGDMCVDEVVNYRISKSSWFTDEDSEVIARISQRVSDFTGLSMETAELSHVANYGIGGHYEPHFDHCVKFNCSDWDENTRDRIATFLIYMSDVAQGGATVFPKLGLTVFPVRGAALYWRNLHNSGHGDEAMLHAACPVLSGDRWVLSKWIHEVGQEFLKPCHMGDNHARQKRRILEPVVKTNK